MTDMPREIRGLMITVTGGRVLLPNTNVSEIITAATPEAIENAPPWLLGRVRWRGWRVPLFSFSILSGISPRDGALNAKVTVLKALGGNPRLPFLAMLCLGFPRLTTISPEILVPTGDDETEAAPGVRVRVLVRDDDAYIPDLPQIEHRITEALAAAA
jgi:chemosensory pili system protein ChpC